MEARQALTARPQELDGGEAERSTERYAGALVARAAGMAELAAALARLLPFAAARLPAAFLGAGAAAGVNLARLAETSAFVVMQARRLPPDTCSQCAAVCVHARVRSHLIAGSPCLCT